MLQARYKERDVAQKKTLKAREAWREENWNFCLRMFFDHLSLTGCHVICLSAEFIKSENIKNSNWDNKDVNTLGSVIKSLTSFRREHASIIMSFRAASQNEVAIFRCFAEDLE